jgi:hypothetical protein
LSIEEFISAREALRAGRVSWPLTGFRLRRSSDVLPALPEEADERRSNLSGGDSSRLLISKEQRDRLFEPIISKLTGADAIVLAVRREEWGKADRLCRTLYDGLTFLLNDFGWVVDHNDRPMEVSTSPLVVREVLEDIRTEAKAIDPDIDLRDAAEENQELIVTCNQLLAALKALTKESSQGSAENNDDSGAGD